METGECVQTFGGHERSVRSAVFSADDATVLTASSDSTAKLWSVATGECIVTLADHTDAVGTAAFAP